MSFCNDRYNCIPRQLHQFEKAVDSSWLVEWQHKVNLINNLEFDFMSVIK